MQFETVPLPDDIGWNEIEQTLDNLMNQEVENTRRGQAKINAREDSDDLSKFVQELEMEDIFLEQQPSFLCDQMDLQQDWFNPSTPDRVPQLPYSSGSQLTNSPGQSTSRSEEVKARNRENAKISRERQKHRQKELEDRCNFLETENKSLKSQLSQALQENLLLKSTISQFNLGTSQVPFLVPQPQFQFGYNQATKLPIPKQPSAPKTKRPRKTKAMKGAAASLLGIVCVVVVFGFNSSNFEFQSSESGLVPNTLSNFRVGRSLKSVSETQTMNQANENYNQSKILALPNNSSNLINSSLQMYSVNQHKILALPENSNSNNQLEFDQEQILALPIGSNSNRNSSDMSNMSDMVVPVLSNEEAEENALSWLDLVGQDLMLQSRQNQIGSAEFWTGLNQAGYDAPVSCKEVIQFDAVGSQMAGIPILSFKKQSNVQLLSPGREKIGNKQDLNNEDMVSLFLPVHSEDLKVDKLVVVNKVYIVIVRSGELYVTFECELQQKILV
eukprot:TRINITY_DN4242_c0_g1_i7.p1 TRINITY_DN4242_c0_g1~~TRINITY_DN4242_c0_g1_i7.p1  ORF type:complete len:501 (-),score=53.36 TRINITY_DN4242_c0_g1_i7:235-1737(-)